MSVPTTVPMRRGLLLVAIAATAWGSGGAVAEILYRTTGLGPIGVCWWRLLIGAAVLTGVRLVRRPDDRAPVDRWRTLAIGVGLAIAQAAYFGAVADIGVAVATMVTLGAGPVLVAVGARFTLGERLSPLGLVTVVIAVAGLALLTSGAATAGARPALGVGLALLAAAGQALTTVLSRATGDRAASATAVCWIGAVGLAPFALFTGALPGHGVPIDTAGWLLYLGTVPTALAYLLFFAGLATVPATVASVVILLEPVSAAVIAVGLLGERLAVPAIVGGAVLLGAVTMTSVVSGRAAAAADRRIRLPCQRK
ncbi:MAG TPA: DMT family transporter [Pseudonocardiaceae bacterium]|jgi:DME family drug/metabolite transporter|nr:DMT family transporter [Pseudonocardiaceae bacterium]